MIDHNWAVPHSHGVNGSGMTIGLMDDPTGYHQQIMRGTINVVAPGANVILGTPGSPLDFARLAQQCQAIAIPETWAYDAYFSMLIGQARVANVLTFAGVGDGVPTTGQGLPYPHQTSASGPCAIGVVTESSSQACVMAACMYLLWLAYGQYLFIDPDSRFAGFSTWLEVSCIPTQRGMAPDLTHI